jgi:hypothetical protein
MIYWKLRRNWAVPRIKVGTASFSDLKHHAGGVPNIGRVNGHIMFSGGKSPTLVSQGLVDHAYSLMLILIRSYQNLFGILKTSDKVQQL